MDFTLSDDQQLLMTAFEGLLERYRVPRPGVHGYVAYSSVFQNELRDSGFVEIASQPGYGLLEAAMLVEAAATCPIGVEAAASMMIAPLIGQPRGAGRSYLEARPAGPLSRRSGHRVRDRRGRSARRSAHRC
jgi:hypothetical protein